MWFIGITIRYRIHTVGIRAVPAFNPNGLSLTIRCRPDSTGKYRENKAVKEKTKQLHPVYIPPVVVATWLDKLRLPLMLEMAKKIPSQPQM